MKRTMKPENRKKRSVFGTAVRVPVLVPAFVSAQTATFAAVCVLAITLCTGSALPSQIRRSAGSRPADARFKKAPRGTITLAAVGDVLLARIPGRRLADYGKEYVFGAVRDSIEKTDLAFANLETAITARDFPPLEDPYLPVFRAPPENLNALAWAGFDVVSIANNHIHDAGDPGPADTCEALDAVSIAHAGAGRNEEEARRPAIIERGGYRIAFLAYTYPGNNSVRAGPDSPGEALLDRESILMDIRKVRKTESIDFVFVSLHWGGELSPEPEPAQRDLGRACIEAGATAVLGHHPHVIQGVEKIGNGVILYSLGNFVFDMVPEETNESVIGTFTLVEGGIRSVSFSPIVITRPGRRTEPAGGERTENILNDVVSKSGLLGSQLRIHSGIAVLDF